MASTMEMKLGEVAQRIRELRVILGISVEEAAEKTNETRRAPEDNQRRVYHDFIIPTEDEKDVSVLFAVEFENYTVFLARSESYIDEEKCVYQDGYEYVLDSGKVFKLKRKKLTDCTFYLSD